MLKTYINTSNLATGGVALDATGGDVEIVKLIIGNPVASANIYIYDESNVGNISTNTTGLVSKLTLPASFATGQLPFTIDLTDGGGHGIILGQGGTVGIDQALQLTVIYGPSQQEGNTI
jgi:hypothetical protein